MLYDKYASNKQDNKDDWKEHATPSQVPNSSPGTTTDRSCRNINWAWVTTASIFALLFLGSTIAGSVLLAQGSSQKKSLSKIDPLEIFEYLGEACEIQRVNHEYYTEKRSESCGNKCTRYYHVCVDEMSYSFTIGGDDSVDYTSRIKMSTRNRRDGNSYSDRCDGEGLAPYSGTYLDKDLPFVCEGGICEVGDMVNCWQPYEACSDEGCDKDHKWAECGNEECKKLVDPEFEYDDAVSDAHGLWVAGVVLLPLGAFFCILTVFIKFCCSCTVYKQTSPSELTA